MTYHKIDALGHMTRFSDSSFYDEVCVFCSGTDGHSDNSLQRPCPRTVPAGATEYWVNVSYMMPKFEVQRNFAVDEPTYRHRPWQFPMDPNTLWEPGEPLEGGHHF